ncbi:GGDEF domain-containing protein [Deinococcus sp. RM]|uniref:GGDEF domain-containing protein n=1 Tax=Deinococcus sp. RM TaxID=2316359 RepID=UPI000E67ED70|nr:GGDEF domain-containing protein [Deinococcus sp. RM]RIY15396.1 GGDEF domain-containing protein [Deinococcus sp. RM]
MSAVTAHALREELEALARAALDTDDLAERTTYLRDAAYLALDLGDAPQAMTHALACLDAARRTADLALQARAHMTIALVMGDVHDDVGAATHFREAEGLARSARDARGVAATNVNAAHYDQERGHFASSVLRLLTLRRSPYAAALEHDEQGKGLDQVFHVNFVRGAASALLGLGVDAEVRASLDARRDEVHAQLQESAAALRRLHRREVPLKNSRWLTDVLESLLIHARLTGDAPLARQLADEWVRLAGDWNVTAQLGRALLGRAELRAQLGEWPEVRVDAARAAELFGDDHPSRALSARQLLARAFAAQGEWRAAFEVQQALSAQAERIYRAFMQQSARLRIIERQAIEAEVRAAAFAEAALRDPLTGIPNRAGALRRLDQLVRSARRGRPCAVALLDIDHFKSVNDRFGHAAGDEVLRRVAATVTRSVREVDLLARYGGEEFLLLLDGLTLPEARRACRRVGQLITEIDWEDVAPGLRVTASIGLAAVRPGLDREVILREADAAMYAAKAAGRNTVRLSVTSG